MELNGVANIKMYLESGPGGDMPTVTYNTIMKELDLLERYMLAIGDAQAKAEKFWQTAVGLSTYVEIPQWHEVRENPKKYPTARERIEGFKKQMRGE